MGIIKETNMEKDNKSNITKELDSDTITILNAAMDLYPIDLYRHIQTDEWKNLAWKVDWKNLSATGKVDELHQVYRTMILRYKEEEDIKAPLVPGINKPKNIQEIHKKIVKDKLLNKESKTPNSKEVQELPKIPNDLQKESMTLDSQKPQGDLETDLSKLFNNYKKKDIIPTIEDMNENCAKLVKFYSELEKRKIRYNKLNLYMHNTLIDYSEIVCCLILSPGIRTTEDRYHSQLQYISSIKDLNHDEIEQKLKEYKYIPKSKFLSKLKSNKVEIIFILMVVLFIVTFAYKYRKDNKNTKVKSS